MKKSLIVVTVIFFIMVLSFDPLYAQTDAMSQITSKFDSFFVSIKRILATIMAIVFFIGIIHVVAAKSDRDPERFKKLIMNYIIAIVFVLISVGVISILQRAFSS